MGARHGGGVGDGAGGLGVAVDAIGAGAEYSETFALIFFQLQCAGHDKLLVASTGAGCTGERDRHLAHADQAQPLVLGTQSVEEVEQVARGSGIVPVVATVVDRNVIAGSLGQGARILNKVVAGEKNLED